MKKAILTFGLFSLVVLTSFTTTENQTQNIVAETGDTGGAGQVGGSNTGFGNRKLDNFVTKIENSKTNYSNNSIENLEIRKKSDI